MCIIFTGGGGGGGGQVSVGTPKAVENRECEDKQTINEYHHHNHLKHRNQKLDLITPACACSTAKCRI